MYSVNPGQDIDLNTISRLDFARLCFACGICVGDCPAARFSEDFNPRQIFLKVCLGIGEGIVGGDSPIWKCTTCYTCYERCPAGVKPLDIIIALRNLSFRQGSCPEGLRRVREDVLAQGRSGVATERMTDVRRAMGLPDEPTGVDLDLEPLIGA